MKTRETIISYYNHSGQIISTPLMDYLSSFPLAVLLGDMNSRPTMFGDHNSNPNVIRLAHLLIDYPIVCLCMLSSV